MQTDKKINLIDLQQGSQEWLDLRKTKITATDASVIMGVNPWKTKIQLYHEKTSDSYEIISTERMQRGLELEPIARDIFNIKTGWNMQPAVIVKDWLMASLDGRDASAGCILEIKCPGEKDHAIALQGKIPDHYYPQLQHQIYLSDVQMAYYFSFDGADGAIVKVNRDEDYIEKMLEEEIKFYDYILNKNPPEDDYIERDDDIWRNCAAKWKFLQDSKKRLEQEEEELRKQLIFLSGESNTKGAGISLCQVQRKGNVEYAKIPELKGVDLDRYRKNASSSWRITCH